MAAVTGAPRDRFVDLLRGGSIVAVVVGHWLVADVVWSGHELVQSSALGEVPAMWPLTWLLVVIPLFFFVGGFSNRRSWEGTLRRGEGYAAFLDRRVHRVLAPTGLYLVVITAVGLLVDRLGGLGIRAVGGLFLQPLWFLGVYLWVVALVPLTLLAHRRYGWRVPAALGLLVVVCDVGRYALDWELAGYANVLIVWLLMHQLGYAYADGSLTRPVAVALTTGGLTATAALVLAGPYSAPMVGATGGDVGNMHPPNLAITTLGVCQVGIALLVRDRVVPWLERPRVWAGVVLVNLSVVTLYLWHQPALAIAARLVLPRGLPAQPAGSLTWWVAHLLWLTVPGVVLVALVAVFGRAERVDPPAVAPRGPLTAGAAAIAVVVLGLGLLGLAGSSATEPFEQGATLGPFVASPVLGLSAVAASAWVFHRLPLGSRPTRRALLSAAALLLVVAWVWSLVVLVLLALLFAFGAVTPGTDRPRHRSSAASP